MMIKRYAYDQQRIGTVRHEGAWSRALTDEEMRHIYRLATTPDESRFPGLWEGYIDPSGKGVWHKINGEWTLEKLSQDEGCLCPCHAGKISMSCINCVPGECPES